MVHRQKKNLWTNLTEEERGGHCPLDNGHPMQSQWHFIQDKSLLWRLLPQNVKIFTWNTWLNCVLFSWITKRVGGWEGVLKVWIHKGGAISVTWVLSHSYKLCFCKPSHPLDPISSKIESLDTQGRCYFVHLGVLTFLPRTACAFFKSPA